jgi:hypothetical protein
MVLRLLLMMLLEAPGGMMGIGLVASSGRQTAKVSFMGLARMLGSSLAVADEGGGWDASTGRINDKIDGAQQVHRRVLSNDLLTDYPTS